MISLGIQYRILTKLIAIGTAILCRIDKVDLDKVSRSGPLIIFSNHINMLEVPLIFSHLQPRPVTAMAKAESWENPLFNWLFDIWKLIPVRRGEADMTAIRITLSMLKEGYIFGIAPEGTRSHGGQLQRGLPGIVPIAMRSKAPLQPVAHWGGEEFPENVKRLRRTDFHIRVGKPFYLESHGERVSSEVRQIMVDEMMYQLAKLLPEHYRGYYADLENATEKYLRFS